MEIGLESIKLENMKINRGKADIGRVCQNLLMLYS